MANLRQVLKQLRGERRRTRRKLSRFHDAIAAFERLVGINPGPAQERKRRARRKLSAAGRKRISQAQKARWAKLRKEKAAKT